MRKGPLILAALLMVFCADSWARVISYAPVTSRFAVPAVQRRDASRFVLLEDSRQVVVYATAGADDPKVVLEASPATLQQITFAAANEVDGRLFILVGGNGDSSGTTREFMVSSDGGASWNDVGLPGGASLVSRPFRPDVGGPVVRQRDAAVRLGGASHPFYLSVAAVGTPAGSIFEIHAIEGTGRATRLAWVSGHVGERFPAAVVGSDLSGETLLVAGRVALVDRDLPYGLYAISSSGSVTEIAPLPAGNPGLEAWIASDGSVYADSLGFGGPRSLIRFSGRRSEVIATLLPGTSGIGENFFAVPTAGYDGAWIVQRGAGQPTILAHHSTDTGLFSEQWRDPSGPEIEAVHAGASGSMLLIQVHREREVQAQRAFIDPALAIWKVGDPAPADYDEFYLNEAAAKSFVNLDVDAVAAGASFAFDSAGFYVSDGGGGGGVSAGGGGGGEVVREWGVVRASLIQHLVIQGVAHLDGAFGSQWRTDVIIRNPYDEPLQVLLRLRDANGSEFTRLESLAAREIVRYEDIVGRLFGLSAGGGALLIEPPLFRSVDATSRTYNVTADGTFGMGVPAVDVHAATPVRDRVTFAAGLLGPDYRTNLLLTNVTARLAAADVVIRGYTAEQPRLGVSTFGQWNDLGRLFNVTTNAPRTVTVVPAAGELLAGVVAIDNRSNDPTFFSPDMQTTMELRTIPVIGHLNGANGARFRTDVYVSNPSANYGWVALLVKPWETSQAEIRKEISLPPGEQIVLSDVLYATFGTTGLARLRYGGGSPWMTVTSRTYSVTADGATYGQAIPPTNSFGIAGRDDALDIIGAVADRRFRTNVGVVETGVGVGAVGVTVEVYDARSRLVRTLPVWLPISQGRQLLDVLAGLEDGPVLIRVRTSGGNVTAFASMVDGGTNDPTYLPPRLSAK
jgi:hypothetical protein